MVSFIYMVWVGAYLPNFHLNLALFVPLTVYWLKWGLANTVLLFIINTINNVNNNYHEHLLFGV